MAVMRSCHLMPVGFCMQPEMVDFQEHRICIKFCFIFGATATTIQTADIWCWQLESLLCFRAVCENDGRLRVSWWWPTILETFDIKRNIWNGARRNRENEFEKCGSNLISLIWFNSIYPEWKFWGCVRSQPDSLNITLSPDQLSLCERRSRIEQIQIDSSIPRKNHSRR